MIIFRVSWSGKEILFIEYLTPFISLLLFIPDTAIHIEHIDGYTLLAHNLDASTMSKRIKETLTNKKTSIDVYLGPSEILHFEESKFQERCAMYFEKNFETLAEVDPLILPGKLHGELMGIEDNMGRWCKNTNSSSSIKGLILHSFSLTKCLKLYGFTEKKLRHHLQLKKFSEKPIIVVYNPREKAILLIRKAESETLANDIELSFTDIKLFILLFNDELKNSGMKLIPLVVTAGKSKYDSINLDCQQCLDYVLSEEELKSFESRWKNKDGILQVKSEVKPNKGFSKDFLAKATSLMAATCIYHECIPKLTNNSRRQMESLAVLLTREQMEILYSKEKHVIIKGGFGCGKTIVAAAILEKISKKLLKHEQLFYICYDSRSALINHMTEHKQRSDLTNVIPIHNEKRLNLSEIVNDIMQKKKSTEKVNFVIDEYDGEDLDKSEAKRLNDIFTNPESLKEAFIFLIIQPIEKERRFNNIQRYGNMFHLLKTMKTHQLTMVMRNSAEIHKLIAATKKILIEERTVYIHQGGNETVREAKSEKENQKVSANSLNGSTLRQKDRREYSEEFFKLGVDEAQAIVGSPAASGGDETVSKFTHAAADKIGHKISSKRPGLFELEGRNEFQKVLSLIAIFEKMCLQSKEHVVLHFDTVNNEVPSTLQFIFEHHFGMHKIITNNYKDFISSEKQVLVCSYLTFRGLQHSNIVIFIDRDIYFLQHYLVETLSRCTTELNIVALKNSMALTKITEEWKTNQLVNKWETLCKKDLKNKENIVIKKQDNKTIIDATFQSEYCEKLKERFNCFSTGKDETKQSIMKIHAKNLLKQKR